MSKRLMCVIAHPDDECYAFGGALALASRAGVETYVICLTDGQAATNRGDTSSAEELGKKRRAEFEASCKVLGITKYETLDYQDGKLELSPVAEVAALLVEKMRAWQPHVVLTFGLDGAINTHADHSMVSAFTSCAFQWCARAKRFPSQLYDGLTTWTPQKLYHLSTNFTLPDREPMMPAPWTLKLDIESVMQTKIDAFHQHPSQLPVFESVKDFWAKYGSCEYYTLVGASTPREAKMESGMFSDIVE